VTIDATANEPASTPFEAPPGVVAATVQRWKFWGTTFWAVAMVAVFIGVGAIWMAGMAMWSSADHDITTEDFRALLHSHLALEVTGFIVAAVCAFAVMALAIRLSGVTMREYLGLGAVRMQDLKLGFVGLVAIYLVSWLVFYLTGSSPSRYVANLYRGAQANGLLPLVLLGVVVAAPLIEEALIRGFLYRGWAASRLTPIGAVALTAAVWTGLHTQYEWLVLLQIFSIGLLFGAIRRRGGSTTTTILLHGAQNTWSFVLFELLDKLGLISA
jgi:CAAX protease family protein